MRKLKLEVDDLNVESFAMDPHSGAQTGTVHGRLGPMDPDPGTAWDCESEGGGSGGYTENTCIGPTYCCPPTWRQTCPNTCYSTCGGWSRCAQYCDLY